MSLEPQTTAKAVIHTTKGSISIELWAKETPLTSKLFLENALNQRFNGWEFNRVVPGFLIQAGNDNEPNTAKLKIENHPRLKFNKRGLLGCVNEDSSQFFITLEKAPELNNKNTLFGRIVDDSIFAALKIAEGELEGEVPLYPAKILSSEVLIPYFEDLKVVEQKDDVKEGTPKVKVDKKKRKAKVKLDLFNEEEDEESGALNIKMKSSVDVINTRKKQRREEKKSQSIDLEAKEDTPFNSTKRVTNSPDPQTDDPTGVKEENSNEEHITGYENPSSIPKPQREQETIDLLNQFESHLKSMKTTEKTIALTVEAMNKEQVVINSDHDSDFDNLSESEGDDGDLFAHVLKFEENVVEDDLVTIDTKDKNV